MAWWRERLEQLDQSAPPAEPRLQDVRGELTPRGISGAHLSKLEDGWLPLLDPFPWGEAQIQGLRHRGSLLFGISAQILGGNASDAEDAGALWSLVDGATRCSEAESRAALCDAARQALAAVPARLPQQIRPITVLAALAAYDLRPGGRLGRVGAALSHRLRGTIPGA